MKILCCDTEQLMMSNLAILQNYRSEELQKKITQFRDELNEKIIGQRASIELCMSAFFADGHVLLEGTPGVGKTSLSANLAKAFDGEFRRVQMTSDMLPSDILGVIRLKPGSTEFEFRKGPIFTNVLLVDELNRTSPKTQRALLEAIAEQCVSVDGLTYSPSESFFVIATQNPFESHGVYPLTESQLDRFMVQINLTVPNASDELMIYQKHLMQTNEKKNIDKIFSEIEVRNIKNEISKIFLEESVLQYCQSIILATRTDHRVKHGVSIRAGMQLLNLSRSYAFLQGRNFVVPGDIQNCATQVLAHRIELLDEYTQSSEQKVNVIKDIMNQCKAPR